MAKKDYLHLAMEPAVVSLRMNGNFYGNASFAALFFVPAVLFWESSVCSLHSPGGYCIILLKRRER